jgi:hypothetical protein
MLKINFGLGRWQNACAKDSMVRGRQIMKLKKCSLSEGLKQSWKEIKEFLKNLSGSFGEFKQKEVIQKQELKAKLFVKINNRNKVTEATGEDIEDLLESILEQIAEIKGKTYYNNFMSWFVKKYDSAIEFLESKGKYTFAENIWCIMDEGLQCKMF